MARFHNRASSVLLTLTAAALLACASGRTSEMNSVIPEKFKRQDGTEVICNTGKPEWVAEARTVRMSAQVDTAVLAVRGEVTDTSILKRIRELPHDSRAALALLFCEAYGNNGLTKEEYGKAITDLRLTEISSRENPWPNALCGRVSGFAGVKIYGSGTRDLESVSSFPSDLSDPSVRLTFIRSADSLASDTAISFHDQPGREFGADVVGNLKGALATKATGTIAVSSRCVVAIPEEGSVVATLTLSQKMAFDCGMRVHSPMDFFSDPSIGALFSDDTTSSAGSPRATKPDTAGSIGTPASVPSPTVMRRARPDSIFDRFTTPARWRSKYDSTLVALARLQVDLAWSTVVVIPGNAIHGNWTLTGRLVNNSNKTCRFDIESDTWKTAPMDTMVFRVTLLPGTVTFAASCGRRSQTAACRDSPLHERLVPWVSWGNQLGIRDSFVVRLALAQAS